MLRSPGIWGVAGLTRLNRLLNGSFNPHCIPFKFKQFYGMPRTIDVDWEYAKTLFIQGVGYTDIALELGCNLNTVKARAWREGWVAKRDDLRAKADGSIKNLVVRDLKEVANDLKQRLATDVERTLKALEGHDPDSMSLEKLEQRERIASALQKRTWTTLGLDVVETQSVVNVAVMNALAESILNPSQVADTQTTSVRIEGESKGDCQQNRDCANGVEGVEKASFPGVETVPMEGGDPPLA